MSNKWVPYDSYKPKLPDTGIVSGAKGLARNVVSAGIHGAERAVGILGDIPAAIAGVPELIQQQITGEPSQLGTGIYNQAKKILPTTENIRGLTRPALNAVLPEGTLEPQNSGEKGWIDFVETLAGALSPVGGIIHPVLGGVKLGTAFLPAALGQLSKWGAEYLGASEAKQEAVKTGVMLTTALSGNMGTQALFDKGKQLYKTGEESIERAISGAGKVATPSNAVAKKLPTIPAPGTKPRVAKMTEIARADYRLPKSNSIKIPEVEHEVEKALGKIALLKPKAHGAAEKAAKDYLEGLQENIHQFDKTMPVESLVPYKLRLNRLFYEGTPIENTAASTYLGGVKSSLKNAMAKNQTKYPGFKDMLEADQLYAAAHGAREALGYAAKAVEPSLVNSSTTALLLGAAAPILKPAGLAYTVGKAIIGGSKGLKNAYNALDILRKSPAVRKHWQDVMSAALKQNAVQLNKAVKKLDEAVIKEERSSSGQWKPYVKA